MRQDLVDKVMGVDGVLHVFDMSKLATKIPNKKNLRILNLQRRILHALFCIVLSILYYCTQRKDFFINGFDINISIVSIKIQKTELALCRLSSIEHVRLDFVFGGLGIPVVR